jgi:hypothetical protein
MHYARFQRNGDPTIVIDRWANRSTEDLNWSVNADGYRYAYYQYKRILEHRFIWQQHHGRVLRPFENIHHINGIRHDNRIENLELWTKAQPCGQRPEDLVKWVVDNYPDLVKKQLSKGKGKSGRSNSKTPTRVKRVVASTTPRRGR